MKRKLLLAALLVVGALGFNANAKEDVTHLIENADLSSLEGWNFISTSTNKGGYTDWKTSNDPATYVNVLEFWAGDAYEDGKFKIYQSVNLQEGNYRIAMNAFYREGWDGNGTNSDKAWIFATGTTEGDNGKKKQNVYALNNGELNGYTGDPVIWKASNAFFKGVFSNEFDFTIANSGVIEIGLEGQNFNDGASWCIFGPVKLYKYEISDFQDEYQSLVSELKELLANVEYMNVTGRERTDINVALATPPSSVSDYIAVIAQLKDLRLVFTAAKTSYDELTKEKEKAIALGMDESIVNGETYSPADANDAIIKVQNLKVAEYNYVTTTFQYPVEVGAWTTKGAGSMSGQHWDGTSATTYNEQDAEWGSDNWSCSYTQDLSLPNGNYVFKVAGRKSSDYVNLQLTVTKDGQVLGTVNDFPNGDEGRGIDTSGATNYSEDGTYAQKDGQNIGRGWEWRYVKFTLNTDAVINIAVNGSVGDVQWQWLSFCNATIQTDNEANIAMITYNVALNSAKTTIADATYANVGGTDRTGLQETIDADLTLDKNDKAAIEAATTKLNEAVATFTAGVESWNKYANAKKYAGAISTESLPYASEESIAEVADVIKADVTDAASAEAQAEVINSANRTAYESNANAEGVYGIDMTKLITNPNTTTTDGWSATGTAKDGSELTDIWTASNEPFTDAMGNSTFTYLDRNTFKSIEISQTIENLPAGKYILSVTARCQDTANEFKLNAGDASVNIPIIGNANGVFNRGWNDATVEFVQTKAGEATISVTANTNGEEMWLSVTRFRLAKIAEVVTFDKADYATLSSESALDLSEVEAYVVKEQANEDYITLVAQNEPVEAGTGLILKGTGTVAIPFAEDGEEVDGNYLIATDGSEVPAGNYVLARKIEDSEVGFYELSAGKEIEAGKAYLSSDVAAAGIKVLRFAFDNGTATAIEATEIADADEDGAIYNVAGQQVAKDYKGIVIKNGKKYLNK